ncbi:hypothetical protein ACQPW1_24520 [Nocardia sp. CA-128927]|uniref:hypothetical protein n=1 Tax=Nocardia sp. CA-128927 TaxID=3239975 RepID=UPI003D956CA9
MTRCPMCFNALTPERVSWMATSGETKIDEVASRYYGAEVQTRHIVPSELKRERNNIVLTPSRALAAAQVGSQVEEVCPYCHYRIPDGWRDSRSTCIAMAGARYTGKTVYVAVLIKALQLFGERIGCVVEPNDQRTADTYQKHYQNTLYVQRQMLPPTSSIGVKDPFHRDPLIFRLGHWNGRKQYLVIRDVAGEDLHDQNNIGQTWTKFFGNADGVVYMFDPLKVPSIASQLRDLIPAQETYDVAPITVLQTVISMIGPHNPKLAVVLSKFDALHALKNVAGTDWSTVMGNPGAGFSRDPSLIRGPYDNDDGELVDAEVRSLLVKLGAKPIIDAADSPHTGARLPTRFFAVSALGALPAGEQVHESGISPFRCLDPARWILSEAGVWN